MTTATFAGQQRNAPVPATCDAAWLETFRSAAAEVSPTGETPPVGWDTPIGELGLDSVEVAELLCVLQERTGIAVHSDALYDVHTVRDLVRLLARAA